MTAAKQKDRPLASDRVEGRRSKPNALGELLTVRIIRLLDLLRRSGTIAHRRRFGLSELEWRIMTQVGARARLSLNDLAEALNQDRGQLSRAVKAMVERDLLTRRRQPGGPAIVIALSANGETIHAGMIELAIESDAFLVGDIAREDMAVVASALDSLVERAQQLLQREREAADS